MNCCTALICGLSYVASVNALQRVNVSLSLNPVAISEPIAPNFVGLSIEVPSAPSMIGRHSEEGPRQVLLNLLENWVSSTPSAKAVGTLRIGGNSADESVFNPNGNQPDGNDYNITHDDLESYEAFADLANGRVSFVLGLNFQRGSNASWAADEVTAVKSSFGWDRLGPNSAVEVGNEIDLFSHNGIREQGYNYTQYAAEFQMYASAIQASGFPPAKIQGATFCCEQDKFDDGFVNDYVHRFKAVLGTNSYHRYPTAHCNGGSTTLAKLLSPESSRDQARYLSRFSIASRQQGTPFVIGESNSVACGGQDEVSNVLGTSLWGMDYLMSLASINVTSMNFHGGPRGIYPPIAFNSTSAGSAPDVRPLYYGALLFSETVANHSVLLGLEAGHSDNLQVRTWMARDGITGGLRLLVIHKDPNATEAALVGFTADGASSHVVASVDASGYTPPPCQAGRLIRLSAPGGILAKYGLSISGQTFDGSKDGKPVGQRKYEDVSCQADGNNHQWGFLLQPGTAAVLHLPVA